MTDGADVVRIDAIASDTAGNIVTAPENGKPYNDSNSGLASESRWKEKGGKSIHFNIPAAVMLMVPKSITIN